MRQGGGPAGPRERRFSAMRAFEAVRCNEIVTRAWTRPSRPSPILRPMTERARKVEPGRLRVIAGGSPTPAPSYRLLTQVSAARSEEHTSELQSRSDLVCRLLLGKKKTTDIDGSQ